jgi:uncharacterized protein YejL (UPF0352 family)
MSWIDVAAAALCGLVAAAVVFAALRRHAPDKPLYVLAWLVVAGLLFGLANAFITPGLQSRYDASRVDQLLSGNAAFAVIRKHDSPTYERLMSELRAGLLRGQSRAELVNLVRSQVSVLVQQRVARASDEAATEYMRVMVQEMGELRRQGGDLCYRFLFAKPGQGPDLSQYVSANTVAADAAALSQVLRSATLAPQAVPQQAEVAVRLKPVVAALSGRYGPDLALLQRPQAPGVDRDKLCSISIDMYTVILQLPLADSGKLIRYLMGQG